MNNTEQLDALFARWKCRYGPNDFAQDGIIDEELWSKAQRKILFILKETNNFSGDVRKLIKEKPWPVWGYWCYGLLNTTADNIPPFYQALSDSAWKDAHRSTAMMNLKKSPGKASADMNLIELMAQNDKDLIINEIEIITPHVIICGATFDICMQLFGPGNFLKVGPDNRCYISMNALWINYWHPGWFSLPHIIGYYGLMSIFQNAFRESQVAKLFS